MLRRKASLYPIGSADKRFAINFTPLLPEVSMPGLKQRGATWYLMYYVNNKERAVSRCDTDQHPSEGQKGPSAVTGWRFVGLQNPNQK